MRTLIAALLATVAFPQFVTAQTEALPCPSALMTVPYEVVEMDPLDVEAAWRRAAKETQEHGRYLYGVV